MQGVDMMNLAAAISHFLNCYLGSFATPHTQVAVEETVNVDKEFCIFLSSVASKLLYRHMDHSVVPICSTVAVIQHQPKPQDHGRGITLLISVTADSRAKLTLPYQDELSWMTGWILRWFTVKYRV